MAESKYDLEDRLINFSIQVTEVEEKLPNTRFGIYTGGQILRSGTSPALNYGEVQGAKSKADFLHKLKVCLKELRETSISLKIIKRKPLLKGDLIDNCLKESLELVAIFTSSVQTAKTNNKK